MCRAAVGPADPEYPMNTARLPRKLKILAWAATSVCVTASLVAGAKPPTPQATITSLGGGTDTHDQDARAALERHKLGAGDHPHSRRVRQPAVRRNRDFPHQRLGR